MLEAIAKNIATAIFLACAMLVNSLLPEKSPRNNISPSKLNTQAAIEENAVFFKNQNSTFIT